MKRLAALAVFALGALALWARPLSIQCPRDGWAMYFDHQVGEGKSAVCWYSHYHNDIGPDGKMTSAKHDFFILCDHP